MNNGTIADLERLKESLLKKIEVINETIRLYRSLSADSDEVSQDLIEKKKPTKLSPSLEKYKGYDKASNYKLKIAAILRAEGRFLSVREISEIICSLEPNLKMNDIKKAVGSAKSTLLKENTIVKHRVGPSNNNSFYGSKNWLDNEGNPKPEHMYNKDLLINTKEEIKI